MKWSKKRKVCIYLVSLLKTFRSKNIYFSGYLGSTWLGFSLNVVWKKYETKVSVLLSVYVSCVCEVVMFGIQLFGIQIPSLE